MKRSINFFACVLGMPLCVYIMPGLHMVSVVEGLAAGALLGVAYMLLRPLLKLLTLPIGCITLGLSGVIIDTALVLLCSKLVQGFTVDNFGWALAAALFINLICAPATAWITKGK